MRPLRTSFYLALLATLLTTAPAMAQSAFPFSMSLLQDGSTRVLQNGSSISFTGSAAGEARSATLNVTYTGTTTATFDTVPLLTGSDRFAITTATTFPAILQPNQSITLEITFTPQVPIGSAASTGLISWPFVLSGPTNTTGSIALGLSGGAADLSVSYVLATDGNITPLSPGGTILFPETFVNSFVDATVLIRNQGSGTGRVNGITVSGAQYQLRGLPGFPVLLAPGQQVQVVLRYSPQAAGTHRGTINLDLGSGPFAASVEGTGIVSLFSYEFTQDGATTPVNSGERLTFTSTKVGETNRAELTILNAGAVAGTVSSISLTGSLTFGVIDGPPLPQTLQPGQAISFAIAFTPTAPETFNGRIRIGRDFFDLTGVGLASRLVLTYLTGSEPLSVSPGGVIGFPQQSVGQTTSLTLALKNTGTLSTTVTTIGIVQSDSVFNVTSIPDLPFVLAPNQEAPVTIDFTSRVPGLQSGNLAVNSFNFILNGLATAPPVLPSYRFSGASGVQPPFSQPAVRLSLDSTYPVEMVGLLTLTQDSGERLSDPAVQFVTGGRTVDFRIPANSTDAIFPNGSNLIRLQTGSVATSIALTPQFATSSGVLLTPPNQTKLQLSVAPAAPELIAAELRSISANSLSLAITGFTTTRSLSSLTFTFTASDDVDLPTSTVSIDLTTASSLWFRSTSSASFGGQFVVTVPFTLQDSTGGLTSIVDKLVSVSVTAANELGSSNAVSVALQ